MKFIDFRQQLLSFSLFSLQDIRKIDPDFDSRRLVEWQKAAYIKKVINGWYVFSGQGVDELFCFLVSNRIYSPSYISLERVLSMHSVIPEGVFSFTAVSPRKTNQFHTCLGHFSYRHLKPELMFGYGLQETSWGHYRRADIEKAILDFLYLHPNVQTKDDFDALRWNVDALRMMNQARLIDYVQAFKQVRLEKRVGTLLKFITP